MTKDKQAAKRIYCGKLNFKDCCSSCHYDDEEGIGDWCRDYFERGGFIIYGCCKACTYFEVCTDEEFKKLMEGVEEK